MLSVISVYSETFLDEPKCFESFWEILFSNFHLHDEKGEIEAFYLVFFFPRNQ